MTGLDSSAGARLALELRQILNVRWNKAWLFFRLAEGAVNSLFVVEGNDQQLRFSYTNRRISDALIELHEQSLGTGSEVRNGTCILRNDGSFEIELGYDDNFSENLTPYFNGLKARYFPGREVLTDDAGPEDEDDS